MSRYGIVGKPLTPTERRVVARFLIGDDSKQAATALNISDKTVYTHRVRIAEKLGCDRTQDLMRELLKRYATVTPP